MRRTETQSLGDIIKQYLKELDIESKIIETQAIQYWHDYLGKVISNATTNIRFEKGKMIVKLNSSVVRNEVMMMRNQIMQMINKKIGSEVIKEIILR